MISVVTVNYKTINYTLKMLESLFTHHVKNQIEVFVVENGSGDDMSQIRKRFPQVIIIESETNLGFAGGCNLAIAQSTGDYIALINPDILFVDEALYMIEKRMNRLPDVGIGGASLKNLDGTQQPCIRKFPKPIDQLMVLLKIHHLFPKIKPIREWKMESFRYARSQDVDQVMGAFFCIRKDVLDQVGLLDDGFFMWYEEVDFCKRTKDAGWRIRYFSEVVAKHKKGSSFERVATIEKQKMLRQSIRRYMKKHYGVGWGIVFKIGEPLFWLMSVLSSVIKPI